MSQTVTRKKKGRPSKADLMARQSPAAQRDLRRSLRRRNVKYVFDLDDYFDEDELFVEDDDRRRREKKLELLFSVSGGSGGGGGAAEAEPTSSSSFDGRKPSKKRKIHGEIKEDVYGRNDEVVEEENYNEDEEEEEVREKNPEANAEEDSPPGTPAEAAPSSVPLPDKKALELILNKLQKKDIYGVYAEPVDPEELPDYHDRIKHPMDFATVRKKLADGSYATLEQFASDVFLICSNAMQYNTPDTVYYKQARTIREMAKKKFDKIRLKIESSENEIKPEQKMRSNSTMKKPIKGSVNRMVQEPVGSDFSSGATPAVEINVPNVTNATQAVGYERPTNVESLVEGSSYINDNKLDKGEEPMPGKGPQSRLGRKFNMYDENRRATYNISPADPVACSQSVFSTFEEESKQLVPVGLYSDHSYARSLARYAAALGSVAWKTASKRIENALPEGIKFGRGWVGDYEAPATPFLKLQNCIVKEPAFFEKVLPPTTDPRKSEKIPDVLDSAKENLDRRPQKLPFLVPAGNRPATIIMDPPPVTRHQVIGDASESKQSLFLSPGIRPRGSANLNFPHHTSQSKTSLESDKMGLKQVELNGLPLSNGAATNPIKHGQISKNPEIEASRSLESTSRKASFSPSGSFKQHDSNGFVGNTMAYSSPDLAKAASNYPHEQGQGLSDPVQLMRMLADKAQNQQVPYQSASYVPQAFSPVPPSSNPNSNNAAANAARVWMSVGAGGYGPTAQNTSPHKNMIYSDSLRNSTRDSQPQASRFRGEFLASGMQVQPDRNSSPLNGFVSQGQLPIRIGNEVHFQNQHMVFPQLGTADLSRFQLGTPWQNPSPQMHPRQKPESLPPDLNIGFQSSGSPGRASSGILVDSQQPDLALQL